jgi:hypothetical protein
MQFEALTAIECNEVFLGYQSCENEVSLQRFGASLCLHHHGLIQVTTDNTDWAAVSLLSAFVDGFRCSIRNVRNLIRSHALDRQRFYCTNYLT